MASLGHIAVGLAAGRAGGGAPRAMWGRMALLALVSLLPDADVIAFPLGIPYRAPFGHRGASHSLLAALLIGLVCAAGARRMGFKGAPAPLVAVLVAASHGLLDMLTDGGLGVALWWPASTTRHFAPWRPLPVAPIGARLLSSRGLQVMAFELLVFAPLFLYALWPRTGKRARASCG